MALYYGLAGLLTVLSMVLIVRPLLKGRGAPPSRAALDARLYRDQLDEVERDLARGTIGEAEAEGARAEVSRRLLAATAQAEATLMDLRQQGIRDLQLIRSGDLLNAVSLGLFSTQAAVNRRLNEIKATGYQPVVVPYSSGNQVYWFDVKIVQNSTYVDDLFTGFPARFNALPVGCNEIAMQ